MTTLFDDEVEVSPHRARALAGTLAGYGWPARGAFERLTQKQQQVALDAAREALRTVQRAARDDG